MILQYIDIFSDGEIKKIKAEITTNHSASSYGQPVVVLPDGDPLNAESWVLMGYQVASATKKEAEMMEKWLKNLYLMLGVPNAAAALGRKGGSIKSDKKTASSRENGKKGGRPCNHRNGDGCASDYDHRRYHPGAECVSCGCSLGTDWYWYVDRDQAPGYPDFK